MTSLFERRICKLGAKAPMSSQNVIAVSLPGQPHLDPACIGPDDILVRISFLGGEYHARY